MSLMTSARRRSSTIAAPPYLMTTVLPVRFLIHGSASKSSCAVSSLESEGLLSRAYFMTGS